MREYIIADNQDISKAGMMFLLSRQKDVSVLLEADNKAELIQQLRLYPQAVVILDYTLFDFAGADELIVLQERFKEADWILFSDELSINFLRQVLFSSMAFGVVMKDNSKEEIMSALQCASRKQRYICNHVSNLLLSGTASSAASSADADRKEYPQRNCTGEDDKRNSGRKEPQLSYNQQPPKEYLPEAGSQQCARSYQVRDACRDCGFSGILYLTAGSVLKGNSLSGYLTTSYTYPRFFIINHPELTGSNALQLLRR